MKFQQDFSKGKRQYLFLAFIWSLAWVIPWGQMLSFQGNTILVFLVDMIKLGGAFFLFIIPGILLFILLSHAKEVNFYWSGFVPIGLTFSVFFISLIGLIGRIFGFSFLLVKSIFVLVGFIEILLLALADKEKTFELKIIWKSFKRVFENIPLLLALMLAVLLMFHDQLFFVDDYTYLAYLTNWQHSDMLGFRNIVHEMDVVENARYWLAMLPMSQAMLADLSGLSGLLLLGSYLELYLVPFAMLSSYWLARFLGVSRTKAGFSILFQIALYSWMIHEYVPTGFWFYLNMSEDKVFSTFLIFPTLLFFSLKYIEKTEFKNLLFVFLAGISMVLTHPVIFVFSVFVILSIALIALFLKKFHWRSFFYLVINFVVMMLPHSYIRLYLHNTEAIFVDAVNVKDTFEAYKVVHVVSDIFYGLAPDTLLLMDINIGNKIGHGIIQIFRFLPVIIAVFAMIIAVKKIKKGRLYWYILASVFLTIFATVPYTGWILGYFVSGRMISRASWFLPLGLGVVLIWQGVEQILKRKKVFLKKVKILVAGLFISFLFVSPVLFSGISTRFSAYFDSIKYYKELAQVGAYVDNNTDVFAMVIALDYRDTQFLPGVSAKTRLISFRERKTYNGHNDSLSVEEAELRISDSRVIQAFGESISANEYCGLIEKYNLRFVLADRNYVDEFGNLVRGCKKEYAIVLTTDNFSLIGFR